MRNHGAEEEEKRADIAEARLQLFIAFPFRFPGNKGKGVGRGKVGEIERGWKLRAAALDYSRGEKSGREEGISRSLLSRAKKTVSEIIRGCVKSSGAVLFGPINGA